MDSYETRAANFDFADQAEISRDQKAPPGFQKPFCWTSARKMSAKHRAYSTGASTRRVRRPIANYCGPVPNK